jgi:hypothetical protein
LFELIKDDLCEKNLAERLWALFEDLLQLVIDVISESGNIDILEFRNSQEYQYVKDLFENSFLSKQMFEINKSA